MKKKFEIQKNKIDVPRYQYNKAVYKISMKSAGQKKSYGRMEERKKEEERENLRQKSNISKIHKF